MKIGPTFASEIEAAGLMGAPFAWTGEGVTVSDAMTEAQRRRLDAVLAAHDPTTALTPSPPDGPTLSDWRVALALWGRLDEVGARVAALMRSQDPGEAVLGRIARERLEYANTVERGQLLHLADALGFTPEAIDESLWRAERVRRGDLSGRWPVPAEGDPA